MTATFAMLITGAICLAWCMGLVIWVAYWDSAHRRRATKTMARALEAILERSGELRRKTPQDAETLSL